MTIALSAIQLRIEQAIDADASWYLSAHDFDDFPPALDSGDVRHLAYAVGLLSTEGAQEDRQVRGSRHVGQWVETQVAVRFLADVRADDKRASYREALDAEGELITLVLGEAQSADLTLQYEGTPTRQLLAPSVRMHEVQFVAYHHLALQT